MDDVVNAMTSAQLRCFPCKGNRFEYVNAQWVCSDCGSHHVQFVLPEERG